MGCLRGRGARLLNLRKDKKGSHPVVILLGLIVIILALILIVLLFGL